MANLRRRSARLSKASTNLTSARKTPLSDARLGSLVERDETPEGVQQSIDEVLATPSASRHQQQLSRMSGLKTPQTEPKPERAEMDPKTVHRSTAKAPDSGMKLGFSDIKKDMKHDTPSKSASGPSLAATSTFEFKFSSDAQLSGDARKLMDNVREDAARIKAQMMAEKAAQEQKDRDTDKMFGAGRKIAQPRGKVGRFSDVHMAQFKKMDSIANHASAFRARPGFAAPTAQSLKRSPSKAGLDEVERPRTAGKGAPAQTRRVPPPVTGRPNSISPFKSIPVTESRNLPGPTKRARQTDHNDVSDSRPTTSLPQPKLSTLYSPTKSSLARTSQGVSPSEKPSMIPRSNSMRSIRSTKNADVAASTTETLGKSSTSKPLPPTPTEQSPLLYPSLPQSSSKATVQSSSYTSKLPTLSGIRSILRGNRKTTTTVERPGTPKRPNTAAPSHDSGKKVDFTPSVKSRHAVKLAIASPSPAKVRRDTPYKTSEPVFPYDSSAYVIQDDGDQDWEDEDSEVTYPSLPPTNEPGPLARSFQAKSRELNRRESKEFKSIFTNLRPVPPGEPTTLTSVNTRVNRTNPETHANKVLRSPSNPQTRPSASTLRHVRTSDVTELVQPFEDKVGTVPHGLPGKKRRHEAINDNDKHGVDDDAKENRRISAIPAVPGGWDDHADEAENEGVSRGGKRVRMSAAEDKAVIEKSPVKKPNAAREAAAKNAKERKGRGVLSLSRLNMLSRPKTRG